ncbi:MFS transporter [Brachybacterium sp. AOP43-C2-M15]|uniref:MFS transporter n=1 Tax=Brachybacterium sp. AOP43-C2-M15 TaxID=3457661 RepID=UPI004034B2C4
MTTTAPAAPTLRANPEYRRWLVGDLCLDLGAGIGMFAFPLITLLVTGSLGATGIVGLVQGLGLLIGIVPGGLLADRCERRRLRLLAGATGVLVQALLIVVLALGWGSLATLAALAFADRLRGALLGGASNAMLKQIVPPALLPRAFAVNEGREAAVEMGSGPLGGALLGVSILCPPLAQLLGNLGSLLATLTMRGRYRPRAADAAPTRVLEDLREAVVWSLSQRIRRQVMGVALAVNLGANGLILTVLLDLASEGIPAARIGILNTVLAAAILLGAIAAPRLVDAVPTGVLAIVPVVVMAAVGVAIPFAPGMVWIGAAYAVMGLGLAPLNAATQGFFMHITPVAMQGRVSSLMGLVSMGLMPLAPALAGWGLELAGPFPTMLLFSVITALGALCALAGADLRRVPVAARWESYARAEGLAAVEDAAVEDGAVESGSREGSDGPAERVS